MSEQRFGWNYFENEVVIGDRQDKRRMIVLVFSNFMCIPYNRKSFDEIVTLLNGQQAIISALKEENNQLNKENGELKQTLENIGLNEKDDAVKMVDGKFFIKM